ncbi:hypothetical protein [Nocardioides jishulii]|uniref:ARB-07466-like C-terminal domain-containing protein n=1 Tax=Nocardioides jishulii TaxID=2575440 RepID=A0A4U2YHU2_9ACTN|nr:hypothetical protein [Nocardioides jishulii]QCX27955.1 hypothetical protein FCL41_10845 [Nocardioides jishulii]TKI60618.1 hypothetical protein FC770_13920 [Nocardioides jishulii]
MAKHRHKRETNARVFTRFIPRAIPRAAIVAAPIAVMATLSAVTLGVVEGEPVSSDADLRAEAPRVEAALTKREAPVSRTQSRRSIAVGKAVAKAATAAEAAEAAEAARAAAAKERRKTQRAINGATTKLWTTATLNLWSASGDDAEKVGLIDSGKKVLVTGRKADGREEIVLQGSARWVTTGYLDDEKPVVKAVGGACTNGTSVPSGVDPSIVKVHRAVCAAFPQVTTYGTFRNDGEHGQGRAVDIMISGETGWEIAEMLRANHAALGIEYLIYAQKIWSVERGGEGWRGMSDRGSVTANHYDHVHVTVY